MKKDLEIPVFNGVGIAIIPSENLKESKHWTVHVVNYSNEMIETVLVNAKGEGVKAKKEKITPTARYLLNDIPAQSSKQFELLLNESLILTHVYWVSYFSQGKMSDKKFVVLPKTVQLKNTINVPVLGVRGIWLND